MICIYVITCTANGKQYVGSTKDLNSRKTSHLSTLRNNRHVNVILQRTYDKYGEDSLVIEVLEELSSVENLFPRERWWINKLNPAMNIGSVGGGDNLTNHPNREDIIARISATLRANNSKLTQAERALKWGKSGDTNPNWRGGKTFCSCGARISSIASSCAACRDRSRDKNPFYGKSHSEETKQKISESRKGSYNGPTKQVYCEGEIHVSLSSAARAYSITPGAMHYRVNSQGKKWCEFYYVNV